jgi:hypothetical protein
MVTKNKKRSWQRIFDKYKSYDDSKGHGSPSEWIAAFRQRMGMQPFMGMSEIAEFFGVKREAVNNWHARRTRGFPKPVVTLAVGPIWLADDIIRYKRQLDGKK